MTQEFVTLPIEVVERALASLESEFGKHSKSASDIRAALEHPQNHVPDAENMAPAGWKLVPVEPTREMLAAACRDGVEINGRPVWKHTVDVQAAWRWGQMLDAAPQPPTANESLTTQPQCEQEPVAKVVTTEQLGLPCLQWLDLDRQFDFKGGELLYTHPQPKREPLTDEAALGVAKSIEIQFDSERLNEQIDDILAFARAIEAAHNIK